MANDKLTNELQRRARACTDAEELASIVREDGAELEDEVLDALAGGATCPPDINGFQSQNYCLNDCTPVIKRTFIPEWKGYHNGTSG